MKDRLGQIAMALITLGILRGLHALVAAWNG